MTRLAMLLCALILPVFALADSYPVKPVRLVMPYPMGTAPDIATRTLTDRISAAWGQPIVVENRPGAGGIVGMKALLRSPPDGYTIAVVPAGVLTLTPLLYKDPQFSVEQDLVSVAPIATSPFLFAAAPDAGIASLAELIQAAKNRPGRVDVAVLLPNSAPHLAVGLLNQVAAVNLNVIPYDGSGAAVSAVLGGHNPVILDGIAAMAGPLRSGRLTPIAVTSPYRLPGFESVPTVAETYPGFQIVGWIGMFARAGIPEVPIRGLNREVNAALEDPAVIAKLRDLAFYPFPGSPLVLGAFLDKEKGLWKKLVQDAGIQPQ